VIKSGTPQNVDGKGAIGLTLGGRVLVLAGLMAILTEVFHVFLHSDQVYDKTVSSDVPHTIISFQIHTCSPSKFISPTQLIVYNSISSSSIIKYLKKQCDLMKWLYHWT
jgi:hypothetical protein